MSRVGKQIISIPSGVTVEVADDVVRVKGPKGTLEERLHPNVTVTVENSEVRVTVARNGNEWRAFGDVSCGHHEVARVVQRVEEACREAGVTITNAFPS